MPHRRTVRRSIDETVGRTQRAADAIRRGHEVARGFVLQRDPVDFDDGY
jgi:hypothetical protein